MFNGLALTINEWAAHLGLEPSTLRMRFYMGWSVERALSNRCGCPGDRKRHPPRGRILEHDGKALHVKEWAAHLGISESTIRQRLKQGHPVEKVLSSGDSLGRIRKQPGLRTVVRMPVEAILTRSDRLDGAGSLSPTCAVEPCSPCRLVLCRAISSTFTSTGR